MRVSCLVFWVHYTIDLKLNPFLECILLAGAGSGSSGLENLFCRADGSYNSWLKEQVGMQAKCNDYRQDIEDIFEGLYCQVALLLMKKIIESQGAKIISDSIETTDPWRIDQLS